MTNLSGKAEPLSEFGEVGAIGCQTGLHKALQMTAMLFWVLVKVLVAPWKVMCDGRNADGLCLGVKPRLEIWLDLDEVFATLGMPVEAQTQVQSGLGCLELPQERWAGLPGS